MGKRQEAVCGPLLPHGEFPEAHQPAEGSLDLPPVSPQPLAGFHPASRDARLNATCTARRTAPLEVVPFVCVEFLRSAPGPTAFAVLDAVHGIQRGFELTRVMDVGASQGDGERQAFSIDEQVEFAARFTAVGGVAPGVLTATRSGEAAAVQCRAGPVELIAHGGMVEHLLEEPRPETVSLPALEGALTGDPAAEPQGGRKLSPGQSPTQDV